MSDRTVTVTPLVADLARAFEVARQALLREPSNERKQNVVNAFARELAHLLVPEILA